MCVSYTWRFILFLVYSDNIIITINRNVYRFPNDIIYYYIVGLARVAFIIIIYRYHLFGRWDRRVVAINSSRVVYIVKYDVVIIIIMSSVSVHPTMYI